MHHNPRPNSHYSILVLALIAACQLIEIEFEISAVNPVIDKGASI